MNIQAVRLFLEVAEAGSLSKVAARRQVVQSHISRQVTDFETSCGGRLFRRTGRGVELTDLGQRCVARLRPWLEETEQLAEELRADAGGVSGKVRVGVIPSAAHPLITRVVERLAVDHPRVQLSICEAQGAELDSMLDTGAVDLAVLFRYRKPSGRDERALCEAGTYLVSAPGDELTREPSIAFSRLAGLDLVLPRQPSHWRSALESTAAGLGFRLRAAVEADSLTIQRELVAGRSGLYSVLGPYSIESDLRTGRLQASRLVRPELVRHVTLALPRHGKALRPTRVVAECIERTVAAWGHRLTEP